jgi:hypothetical protein
MEEADGFNMFIENMVVAVAVVIKTIVTLYSEIYIQIKVVPICQ